MKFLPFILLFFTLLFGNDLEKTCLENKDYNACAKAAELNWGNGIWDKEKASKFSKEACQNAGLSCEIIGGFLIDKFNTADEHKEGKKYLAIGCKNNSAQSCLQLAHANHNFIFIREYSLPNEKILIAKNFELYKKACDLGENAGCYSAAWYLDEFHKDDSQTSEQLYQKACDRGYKEACKMINSKSKLERKCENGDFEVCNELGIAYYNGDEVEQNYQKSNEYFQKACQGDYLWGCYNLARSFSDGTGVKANTKRALEIFEYACNKKHSQSCAYGAIIIENSQYITNAEQKKANELYKKACDDDVVDACYALAQNYEKAKGLMRDQLIANELYDKVRVLSLNACNDDDSFGCEMIAKLYKEGNGVTQSSSKSNEYTQKALNIQEKKCFDGDMNECNNAGIIYLEKTSYFFNLNKAIEFFKIPCDKGLGVSCSNMADAYFLKLDFKLAKEYNQKACSHGYSASCDVANVLKVFDNKK